MSKALIFMVFVLVSGCAPVTVQRTDGPVPLAVRVDDAAYWLEEWNRIRDLPDDMLQRTLQTRERDFAKFPTPRSRLRLSLLLAEGPKSVRDQPRALTLLKGLDTSRASDSAKALAVLLEQIVEEQLWSRDKINELKSGLKQADTRVEELERQLQELTNIEQSIQQRN
ncbi:hypothetical protein DFR30_0604 [Thiogranum longum]|uniref:YfhG lipoprotein n=1 Tax=Thiogranum longum TaxID=1537524 RepID=A0A4R1HB08_9GAMM|nr:hypothetical protein [Thiogranum longum]TCK17375.1 hypothetical protein DFR30_0604 [Thiogranum longum]